MARIFNKTLVSIQKRGRWGTLFVSNTWGDKSLLGAREKTVLFPKAVDTPDALRFFVFSTTLRCDERAWCVNSLKVSVASWPDGPWGIFEAISIDLCHNTHPLLTLPHSFWKGIFYKSYSLLVCMASLPSEYMQNTASRQETLQLSAILEKSLSGQTARTHLLFSVTVLSRLPAGKHKTGGIGWEHILICSRNL